MHAHDEGHFWCFSLMLDENKVQQGFNIIYLCASNSHEIPSELSVHSAGIYR